MKNDMLQAARDSPGSRRARHHQARRNREVLQRAQDRIRARRAHLPARNPDLHRRQGRRWRGCRREEGQGPGGACAQG